MIDAILDPYTIRYIQYRSLASPTTVARLELPPNEHGDLVLYISCCDFLKYTYKCVVSLDIR
jgi:hypothetical protein